MLKIQNIQNTLTPLHPKVIFHHPCHLRSPGHLQNLSSERVPSNPKVTRLRSERSTKRASSKIHETWINEWINQKTQTKKHTHSINVPNFLVLFLSRSKSSKSISSKLRDIRVAAVPAKDAFFHPPGAAWTHPQRTPFKPNPFRPLDLSSASLHPRHTQGLNHSNGGYVERTIFFQIEKSLSM